MCGLYTVAEQIELGFMLYNLHGWFEFFPYVFDRSITFLTVTFFFFWEVGERQRTGFPLSLLGVAWAYLCAIYGPMHVCLLLGEYLHECAQSVGLYVCVACWAPVYVRVHVKCSHKCLAMFLRCGDGDGGRACVYVSARDTICPLDVIPIQMSLMTKAFGLAHRWEELLCFLCPKFHVFSISFTCVFASMAL